MKSDKFRILFVCLGNICRSPTAEGVFRHKARAMGWLELLDVDSAGTADYHVGKAPDARAVRYARERGYDLSPLRARQVADEDFVRFDLILAMDRSNLSALKRQAAGIAGARAELDLLLNYAAAPVGLDVPDPYYGDRAEFEQVLDLVEAASDDLLRHVLGRLGVMGCVR